MVQYKDSLDQVHIGNAFTGFFTNANDNCKAKCEIKKKDCKTELDNKNIRFDSTTNDISALVNQPLGYNLEICTSCIVGSGLYNT